jgi:hypothetical protein
MVVVVVVVGVQQEANEIRSVRAMPNGPAPSRTSGGVSHGPRHGSTWSDNDQARVGLKDSERVCVRAGRVRGNKTTNGEQNEKRTNRYPALRACVPSAAQGMAPVEIMFVGGDHIARPVIIVREPFSNPKRPVSATDHDRGHDSIHHCPRPDICCVGVPSRGGDLHGRLLILLLLLLIILTSCEPSEEGPRGRGRAGVPSRS